MDQNCTKRKAFAKPLKHQLRKKITQTSSGCTSKGDKHVHGCCMQAKYTFAVCYANRAPLKTLIFLAAFFLSREN